MGDAGDYWRDRDAYRRRQKDKMVRCYGCDRLVFPETPCNWCETDNRRQMPNKPPRARDTEGEGSTGTDPESP